ncbi:MAG: hypothetical protein JWO80_1265 [Bryobacterales bacterium]|nr:hypothetical protein [Bryobacterales bacterium]
MSRMCTDPGVYQPDAHSEALGLAGWNQIRNERLWTAAETGVTPQHAAECEFCSQLLASFVRMRSVLEPDSERSAGPVTVAACPDVPMLSRFYYGELRDDRGDAIARHLKICTECRHDVAFLARSQEPRERVAPMRRRLAWMAIAAAALVASLLTWSTGKKAKPEEALNFTPSAKYASLVQMPALDRRELLADSPAPHHSRLEQVLAAYEKGDYKKAEEYATIIVNAVDDPSAEYLLGMAEYHEGKMTEAFRAMRISERMAPQTGYRCWTMLQFALLLGDRATVEKEAHHAGSEPEYAARCKEILTRLPTI